MRTIARAVATHGGAGQELKLPWRDLNKIVTLRTNELVMLAGAPGGGKSTLAVNLAMDMSVPVLYVAQDSPNSVLARLSAVGVGEQTSDTADLLADEDKRGALAARLADVRPTLIYNRGAVTFDQLEQKVFAMREWLGGNPPLILIDNLIDMIVEGSHPSETAFYSTILPRLKRLANTHDTSIVCLHHVTRSGPDSHGSGTVPIKMTDLLFAGEREARHVWGVYRDPDDTRLYVQVLKQQDGPADPNGDMRVGLRWHPQYGKLTSL